MKRFWLAMVLLLCAGCGNELTAQRQLDEAIIVRRHGCQYLATCLDGFNYSFTHKGDCPNPMHRQQGGQPFSGAKLPSQK